MTLEDVLKSDAVDVSHIGDVEAKGVLEGAKNSYVDGNVEAEWVLGYAENSYVKGDVEARDVLEGAKNSYVDGNVEAGENILWHAKNSHIEGNVEAEEDILWHAKNSHILSDTLRADSIGLKAKGGMVAAKEIDDVLKQGIGTGLTILTQSDIEGAVKYNGNWNELSGYISEQLKRENFGDLESLALFKIEKDKKSNLEDFKEELALLSEDYALVKDAIKDTDLEEILDCNNLYSMSNKMKMEVLSDISTVLKKHNKKINFKSAPIF